MLRDCKFLYDHKWYTMSTSQWLVFLSNQVTPQNYRNVAHTCWVTNKRAAAFRIVLASLTSQSHSTLSHAIDRSVKKAPGTPHPIVRPQVLEAQARITVSPTSVCHCFARPQILCYYASRGYAFSPTVWGAPTNSVVLVLSCEFLWFSLVWWSIQIGNRTTA